MLIITNVAKWKSVVYFIVIFNSKPFYFKKWSVPIFKNDPKALGNLGLTSCRVSTCIFIPKWVFLEFFTCFIWKLTWCPSMLGTWQASYRDHSLGTSHLESKNKWHNLRLKQTEAEKNNNNYKK